MEVQNVIYSFSCMKYIYYNKSLIEFVNIEAQKYQLWFRELCGILYSYVHTVPFRSFVTPLCTTSQPFGLGVNF